MKKQLILTAAAALVTTACHGQDTAPPSTTTISENRSTTGVPPSSSEHGGEDAPSETITDGGLATQPDQSREARYLGEVLGILDQNQMKYMGTWSISLGRADLLLEDGTKLIFLSTTDDTGSPKGAELMTVNERFNDDGFQENYLNQYDANDSERYYPGTATRLLRQEELWGYNQTNSFTTRNEIFAHHERKYEDPFLDVMFSRKFWYQPVYSGEEFNTVQGSVLNSNEKKGLALLIQMEGEQEFRKRDGGGYERPVPTVDGSWIDLDLDGQEERITYRVEIDSPYSSGVYELDVGESQMKGPGESLRQCPYTAGLDGVTTRLIIQQDDLSDDPMADIYVYWGGPLKKTGSITGDSIQIYKDFITSRSQHGFFQAYRSMQRYQSSSDAIIMVQEDSCGQNKEAVSLAVIPLYTEKRASDTSIMLNPGDKVMILGNNYRGWVLTQKEGTGERGWLKYEDEDSPYLCMLPDGSQGEPWNLFGRLSFYG